MNTPIQQERNISWLSLIGLVLLGILLWQADLPSLVEVIRSADWRLLLLTGLLNLPMILLKSLRWQVLMIAQSIYYPVISAYLAYFGSLFIGLLTPGRLGEFVKALHVNQDCDVSLIRAFSAVLADRLFDLYTLLLVGSIALTTLPLGDAQILTLTASATLLIAPLVLFLNHRTFGWLQYVGLKLGRVGQKFFTAGGWLSEMRDGVLQLTWKYAIIAILLTSVAYIVFFMQCYLLALALNLELRFIEVSYAVVLGSLITLLPISISGLGTREATIIAYLGTLGVIAESALGFSLLVFVTFYIGGGLIGAVAWWIKPAPLTALHKVGMLER